MGTWEGKIRDNAHDRVSPAILPNTKGAVDPTP